VQIAGFCLNSGIAVGAIFLGAPVHEDVDHRALEGMMAAKNLVIVLSALFLLAAAPAFAQSTFEPNVDRQGLDYANFNLAPTASPYDCQNACLRDGNCRAWTFVRAGVQGPYPRCWLKSVVPNAQGNNCCTSGVINGR
jgi:hypothetical protein